LHELERFFSAELTHSTGGRVVLTGAGRELARLAREHLQGLEEFRQKASGQPLELTLGAGESLHHWHLLRILERVRAACGGAILHLRTLQNRTMVRQLADAALDLALLRADLVGGKLSSLALGRIDYQLCIPNRLRARDRSLTLERALRELPIALQGDDTRFQRDFEAAAGARGWRVNVVLFAETFPQIAQAVASGAVAGVLPVIGAAVLQPSEVWTLPLTDLGDLSREVHLAWNPHTLARRPTLKDVPSALARVLSLTPARARER
jgi:DNA-binding transcriptional LysR family regulator